MDVATITVDPAEVEQLHRAYKDHRHFETDVDREIRQTYAALAKGQTVIQALASIPAAGCGPDGLPKLAIVRADAKVNFMRVDYSSTLRMSANSRAVWGGGNAARFAWPSAAFPDLRLPKSPRGTEEHDFESIVPGIPIHLRPRTALDSYHILYEAEWSRVVPKDPYLLRRIGKADLWLVVAAWDLTEVERAVLQSRVTPN